MFGWRKKSDGFDWHGYVRTTIKVRREARRERIDAARQAALEKAHAAGHAVVDGGKAAGRAAAKGVQVGAVEGFKGSVKGLGWFWHNLARAFRVAFGPLGEWLMASTARSAKKLETWDIAGPVALVGVIAIASGWFRWSQAGLTAETGIPLGLGAVLLLLAAPALLARGGFKRSASLTGRSVKFAALGAAVAVVGAFGYSAMRPGTTALPSLGSLASFKLSPTGTPPVEGRASVVAGDTLRVNGNLYRLSGIDAPERNQTCSGGEKNKWRCGDAAQSALTNLARSKTVACKPSGSADVTGRTTAACSVDGKDIAGELVRGGHVFSASSMFGGYSSLEAEAKAAKRGLWKGDAERPQVWRDKLWADAKKSSPDGCPIKAVSNGSSKVYVLPWAADYKKTTVRTSKGERWFCSEGDAAAAGYRAADRT
jgi:endonuclease YncB( thermonuclease family)